MPRPPTSFSETYVPFQNGSSRSRGRRRRAADPDIRDAPRTLTRRGNENSLTIPNGNRFPRTNAPQREYISSSPPWEQPPSRVSRRNRHRVDDIDAFLAEINNGNPGNSSQYRTTPQDDYIFSWNVPPAADEARRKRRQDMAARRQRQGETRRFLEERGYGGNYTHRHRDVNVNQHSQTPPPPYIPPNPITAPPTPPEQHLANPLPFSHHSSHPRPFSQQQPHHHPRGPPPPPPVPLGPSECDACSSVRTLNGRLFSELGRMLQGTVSSWANAVGIWSSDAGKPGADPAASVQFGGFGGVGSAGAVGGTAAGGEDVCDPMDWVPDSDDKGEAVNPWQVEDYVDTSHWGTANAWPGGWENGWADSI